MGFSSPVHGFESHWDHNLSEGQLNMFNEIRREVWGTSPEFSKRKLNPIGTIIREGARVYLKN